MHQCLHVSLEMGMGEGREACAGTGRLQEREAPDTRPSASSRCGRSWHRVGRAGGARDAVEPVSMGHGVRARRWEVLSLGPRTRSSGLALHTSDDS